MRIIFLGTPEFSVPTLEALHASRHDLVAIVSQPDRTQNRGKKIVFSPVKEFALKHNIPLLQFEKISRDGVESLISLAPDLMVTASYGQILSQEILDIPKYGIINVHASLLPDYRGASPIQNAIIRGEAETGVTIMQTEAGLDTGDIIEKRAIKIGENETAGELTERLSHLGAEMLIDVIEKLENGTATFEKQHHINSLVTKRISKEEGRILWEKSAKQIKCQILGMNPSPVAFSYLNGEVCKIYRAEVVEGVLNSRKPAGTVLPESGLKTGIWVQCGEGILKLTQLQLPSSKVLSAQDFWNGRKIKAGDCFKNELKIEIQEPTIIVESESKEKK